MRDFLSRRTGAVPVSGIRVIFEIAQKMKDVVRLEIGEPDFDTPEHIKEAMREALRSGYTHYTSSAGLIELRQAIAEKVKRDNGISVDPEKGVVVTVGASTAINLAINVLTDPSDEVLVPDPGWPQYSGQILLAGAVPIYYPTPEERGFKPDFTELEKLVTKRSKAIIINSPNNPTGAVLSKDDMENLARVVEEHDLVVISDEVYEKIQFEGKHRSFATLPRMEDRTVTVNAFSKTYAMTGWRLGYAVGREEIIGEMMKLNLAVNSCAPAMTQRAGIVALKGPQQSVGEMLNEYAKRREVIVEGLNVIQGITCVKPDGAFYVFPNIKSFGRSSFDFAKYLIEKAGVATVPGVSFGAKVGEGHLRLSYATSIENIKEALTRIERAVKLLQ